MNQESINKLFNEISPYYDRMNNIISFGLHKHIKKSAITLLNIKPNTKILDLCTGTGDFVEIITKCFKNVQIIGVDKSEKMLEIAQKRHPKQIFKNFDCTNLPFKNEEFDYITIGFGLRNILDRQKALSEINRVLKHGGKFLHLDFGEHNLLNKLFNIIIPNLVKIFGVHPKNYEYLIKSKNSYPKPELLIKEFKQFGFKFSKRKDFLFSSISAQIMIKEN